MCVHLARHDVPNLDRTIDRAADAKVTSVVELCAGDLTVVATQGVQAPACPNVPDLDGVVKRTGYDLRPRRVEMQAHNLRRVSQQCVHALAFTVAGLHGDVKEWDGQREFCRSDGVARSAEPQLSSVKYPVSRSARFVTVGGE